MASTKIWRRCFSVFAACLTLCGLLLAAGCQTAPGNPRQNPYGSAPPGVTPGAPPATNGPAGGPPAAP